MARPPKDPHLRMNTHLRVPVTEEQRQTIMEAVADEPGGFAGWARQVLLRAAEQRVAAARRRKKPAGAAEPIA